jgi:hypothetical protein
MTAIHHFWLSASPYSAVVVSGLFPAHAADGLAPALVISSGNLVEMPRPLDSITAGMTVTGGTLETSLVGARDLGAIAPAFGITAGTLASGLQGTSYSPEAVAASLSVTGGTLYLGLISTAFPVEALAPALGITSGTLT